MESKKINAIHFTATDGMIFVNIQSKQIKKYLLLSEEKADRTIINWVEMTFKEAIALQSDWEKEKFEYLKIVYGKEPVIK